MTDIMLDIETASSLSNAAIIAIGAVKFDPRRGVIDRFYTTISLESCEAAGLDISASTFLWWMKQSEEARKQFNTPSPKLYDALRAFSTWVGDKPKGVWGNGVSFDNVIVGNAYKALNLVQPWDYWADMCYRTVKNLYPHIRIDRLAGVHHNALADAENQAMHLCKIWPLLNVSR